MNTPTPPPRYATGIYFKSCKKYALLFTPLSFNLSLAHVDVLCQQTAWHNTFSFVVPDGLVNKYTRRTQKKTELLSLILRTACARAQFSGCSSTTNAHSETGQMTICCQNLTLGALSSRSALSVLGGALFKKVRSLFEHASYIY